MCLGGEPCPSFYRLGGAARGGESLPKSALGGAPAWGGDSSLKSVPNSSFFFPTVSCFWQFDFQTGHLTFLF